MVKGTPSISHGKALADVRQLFTSSIIAIALVPRPRCDSALCIHQQLIFPSRKFPFVGGRHGEFFLVDDRVLIRAGAVQVSAGLAIMCVSLRPATSSS